MVDFKAKIKDVPDNPGVYMMLDEQGEIIYVGKAKNLKNRLRSYFFNLSNRTAKVMAMLDHVADFRYIICASEVDALLTENNLIKKHTPRYNILLKDDKAYPFLRIDMREPYPTIELVRKLKTTEQNISVRICNRSISATYSTSFTRRFPFASASGICPNPRARVLICTWDVALRLARIRSACKNTRRKCKRSSTF